ANDFMRRYVFEWTPTLDGRGFGMWFTWVYLAELALMWIALIARRRRRPVVDLALALVATAASLSAKRLVPYVAILGLPIVARALRGVSRRAVVARALRRVPGEVRRQPRDAVARACGRLRVATAQSRVGVGVAERAVVRVRARLRAARGVPVAGAAAERAAVA